jgi:hypothetical protein
VAAPLTHAQTWISLQPILLFLYINQYCPTIYKALGGCACCLIVMQLTSAWG